MTPIESTLSGCPAIICDGAIGEVFFNGNNCDIACHDDKEQMFDLVSRTIKYYDGFSIWYEANMRERITNHTWKKVAERLKELL